MTAEELARIKARAEAATKGPWRWSLNQKYHEVRLEGGGGTVMDFVRYGMGSGAPRLKRAGVMVRIEEFAEVIAGREHHADWAKKVRHPDADFISSCREDVPALLAEIERLRGLIKAAEWSAYHETPRGDEGVCPWCEVEKADGTGHDMECPAFVRDGGVR